jgi:hypothetical protein
MSTLTPRLGRALPRTVLAAAVVSLAFASSAALPAQDALPPARTIIDRHIAAMGGREAILAHTSMRVVGTISFPANGISGSLEALGARPNKVLVRMNIAGIGEALEGFDGAVAWSMSPMTGPMLSQGKELEQKKFDADFYSELRQPDRYTSARTLEKTMWNGHPAYKVTLVRHDGSEELEYYDVKSGLRTGREFTRDAIVGPLKVQEISVDYRLFGDLLHPTTSTVNVMSVQQVITIASVEYDKVDPAVFELPAAIKALVKTPAGP